MVESSVAEPEGLVEVVEVASTTPLELMDSREQTGLGAAAVAAGNMPGT